MKLFNKYIFFSPIFLCFFLISCSANKENIDTKENSKDLYESAIKEANDKQYQTANEIFQTILEEYPYSLWATKSKLMMAWVYYEDNKYDSSIITAESFIKNHPENDLVPYALYLIALSYYERIFDVERDTKMTLEAKQAFERLIYLYPNSEYSRDAKLKIELARSNLAGKQMAIGRFYQKQKHFAAAIRRFQKVLDEFETTDQTPEALLRLTECYLSLGIKEEALRTASVLKYNFPQSVWTKKLPQNFIKNIEIK